jgi:hypothetical protein
MDIAVNEVKNEIHKLIVETDDISILNRVQAYFYILKTIRLTGGIHYPKPKYLQ